MGTLISCVPVTVAVRVADEVDRPGIVADLNTSCIAVGSMGALGPSIGLMGPGP